MAVAPKMDINFNIAANYNGGHPILCHEKLHAAE